MLTLLLACGGDDSGVLTSTWWADADGDGFGDPAAAVSEEVAPDGYVDNAEDCDDTDPAVFPGAEEVCDDEVDQDCDGLECHTAGGGYDARIASADSSIFGARGIDGGQLLLLDTGAPGWTLRRFDGPLLPVMGPDDASSVAAAPTEWLALPGDLDGDGVVEVACYNQEAEIGSLLSTADLAGAPLATLAGRGMDAGGDVDGDGVADLGVTQWAYAGMVYGDGVEVSYLRGPIAGEVDLGTAWATLTALDVGDEEIDYLGLRSARADTDGDGVAEVFMVAPVHEYDWYSHHARVYRWVPAAGAWTVDNTDAQLDVRAGEGELHGYLELLGAGDLTRDGLDDVVVAAEGTDGAAPEDATGKVWLIPSDVVGSAELDDVAPMTWAGAAAGDRAGAGLAAGDLDGDGTLDLAIGATGGAGRVDVFLGPVAAEPDQTWAGAADNLNLGAPLTTADLDQDGVDELVAGGLMGDAETHTAWAFVHEFGSW